MRKILIVDDEQIMLFLAQRILSSKYEIITAKSGAEAIKIFEKEKPDLILDEESKNLCPFMIVIKSLAVDM